MNEYKEFIKKYFPQADTPDWIQEIYNLVCENNIMCSVIKNHLILDKEILSADKLTYYIRYQNGLNKLLMYIPLNDDIGIYACMRYTIEQILKFIYSIYFDYNVEKINKTSYRNIKEDIKKSNLISFSIKFKIEKIYPYYAKYSNCIHDKRVDYDKELLSLGDILKEDNGFYEVVNDLRQIINDSYDIIFCIFNISYDSLSLSERIKTRNINPTKRRGKVLKLLRMEG